MTLRTKPLLMRRLAQSTLLAACAALVGCGGGGGSATNTPNPYAGHWSGTLNWTDGSGTAQTATVTWTIDASGNISGTDTHFGTDSGTVTAQGAVDVFCGSPPMRTSPQIVAFYLVQAPTNFAGTVLFQFPGQSPSTASYGFSGLLTKS
jgi:hypothetical protein